MGYSLPDPLTVSLWFNTSTEGRLLQTNSYPLGPGNGEIECRVKYFKVSCWFGGNTSAGTPQPLREVLANIQVVDLDWHHFVVTFEGGEASLYIDGMVVGGSLPFSFEFSPVEYLAVGLGVRGRIDDLRIYDRVLLPNSIRALYELGSAGASKSSALASGDMKSAFPAPAISGGELAVAPAISVCELAVAPAAPEAPESGGEAEPPAFGHGDHLLAHWSFDHGADCLTFAGAREDAVPSRLEPGRVGALGPDCPANAPRPVPGVHGRGLAFDGDDDLVLVASSDRLAMPEQLTLSLWLKQPPEAGAADGGYHALVDKRDRAGDGYGLFLDDLQRPAMRVNGEVVHGRTPVGDGLWHHVAGVWDGAELRLYADGLLDSWVAIDRQEVSVLEDLLLGYGATAEEAPFGGAVDEVRIYDRALDDGEIWDLSEASKAGLVD